MAHEPLFQRQGSPDDIHPGIAQPAQGQWLRPEQSLEAIHCRHHQQVFALAPPLVALQNIQRTRAGAALQAQRHLLGQYGDVLQAQVDSLAGERVNGMRRIANQGVNVDLLYITEDGRIVLGGNDVPALDRAARA